MALVFVDDSTLDTALYLEECNKIIELVRSKSQHIKGFSGEALADCLQSLLDTPHASPLSFEPLANGSDPFSLSFEGRVLPMKCIPTLTAFNDYVVSLRKKVIKENLRKYLLGEKLCLETPRQSVGI